MTVLIGVALLSWRRLANLPRQLIPVPYVAFAMTVVFFGSLAFTSFANLGVLTRERTLLFPFLLLTLCLPTRREVDDARAEHEAPEAVGTAVGWGDGSDTDGPNDRPPSEWSNDWIAPSGSASSRRWEPARPLVSGDPASVVELGAVPVPAQTWQPSRPARASEKTGVVDAVPAASPGPDVWQRSRPRPDRARRPPADGTAG